MDFYSARKIMFKAWNKETKLMMRLDSIQCVKGELSKKDHVLLQFTGLIDKQKEELYELDIVLLGSEKYVIQWNDSKSGWFLTQLKNKQNSEPLLKENALKTIRICNYFESAKEV